MFRVYEVSITFNQKHFSQMWIDPHYEEKHNESITGGLILELLKLIGQDLIPVKVDTSAFSFYETDINIWENTTV